MENYINEIIFYGCWNNPYNTSDNGKPNYYNVIQKIEEYISQRNDIAVVVLGDNYYYKGVKDKTKKEKDNGEEIKWEEHVPQIEHAFNMLNKLNKNIYLLMGNHDIQDFYPTCQLLQYELNLPNKFYSLFPTGCLNNYKSTMIQNLINDENIKKNNFDILKLFNILAIDTTIYSTGNNCTPTSESLDLISIKETQNKILVNFIQKGLSQKIIFGHEPLMTIKFKQDTLLYILGLYEPIKLNSDRFTKPETKEHSLIELIFNSMQENEIIYYFCADDHIMTHSKIVYGSKTIIQTVMGTGGAVLDNCISRKCEGNYIFIINEGNLINLTYLSSKENDYGFGIIKFFKNNISDILYHSVIEKTPISLMVNPSESILQKYLKYKQKYLNLKN